MRVGCDISDSDVIVAEYFASAAFLHLVMLTLGAPANQGFLVTPRGVRQQPTRPSPALETLIVDEAVDSLQNRFQLTGQRQVLIDSIVFDLNLEDYGKHTG